MLRFNLVDFCDSYVIIYRDKKTNFALLYFNNKNKI